MALDAVDTIKSTFGSLKTDAGMKVLGLLFVVQLVNMGSTYLGTMGTGMMFVSALLTLGAAAAMLLITVGAFRSFDSGEVNSEQYTSNVLWPLVRITGANAVTTIFAYGVALVALLPVILVSVLAGAGVSSLGAGAATGGSIVGAVLGIAGGLLAIAAFFYIFLMLSVSIPMISIEDSRVFQALDRSVQRTKGAKVSMFLAALPIGLIYILGFGLIVALAGTGASTVAPSVSVLVSAVTALTAALFFSLLNQFHQRLPE
jgi:hypothetical protein